MGIELVLGVITLTQTVCASLFLGSELGNVVAELVNALLHK